jgi:dTDP-4-amino-4,6-dideoxygalactose transaminase
VTHQNHFYAFTKHKMMPENQFCSLIPQLTASCAKLDEIEEMCGTHSLALIQNACKAHGARYKGRKLGEYGDILCYSFYASKDLGAYGDGGPISSSNQQLIERCEHM